MKKCDKCSALVPDHVGYCNKCGNTFLSNIQKQNNSPMKCGICGASLPHQAKFCINCGSSSITNELEPDKECDNSQSSESVIKCPTCGKFVPASAKFCNACGNSLAVNSSIVHGRSQDKNYLSKKTIWAIVGVLLVTIIGISFYTAIPTSKESDKQQLSALESNNRQQTQPSENASKEKNASLGLRPEDLELAGLHAGYNIKEVVKLYGDPISRRTFQWNNANFEEHNYAGLKVVTLANNSQNHGQVWDVEVSDPKYATARGIKSGDSVAKLLEKYGQPKKKATEFVDKVTQRNCRTYSYSLGRYAQDLNFIVDVETNLVIRISVDSWNV